MKLGDFATIVQLGVGLHAGAALLQLVSDLASAPLSRKLARLRDICRERAIKDSRFQDYFETSQDLISDLDVQSIRIFQTYVVVLRLNALIALLLTATLVWITVDQDVIVSVAAASTIVILSIGPVALSIFYIIFLWYSSLRNIEKRADSLKSAVIG